MSVVSGLHPAGTHISTVTATGNQAPLSSAVQPDSSFAPVTELNASAENKNPAQERSYAQQKQEQQHLTYQLETIEQTRQQNLQIKQQDTGLNDQLLALAEHSSGALQGANEQAKQALSEQQKPQPLAQTDALEARDSSTSENDSKAAERNNADKAQQQRNAQAEAQELEQIRKLSERDIEVKNHEQAHKTVGGQYAGQMSLEFVQGPDGRRYAVGGEVSIDISVVAGDPRATISKMDQIKRAALAPAEPSSQDRQVAAEAVRLQSVAQQELLTMTEESRKEEAEQKVENDEKSNVANDEKENESEMFKALEKERSESSSSDFGRINSSNGASENNASLSGFINTFIPSSSIDEQLQGLDLFKSQADKLGRNLDFII